MAFRSATARLFLVLRLEKEFGAAQDRTAPPFPPRKKPNGVKHATLPSAFVGASPTVTHGEFRHPTCGQLIPALGGSRPQAYCRRAQRDPPWLTGLSQGEGRWFRGAG
jgi:hypothetical protein